MAFIPTRLSNCITSVRTSSSYPNIVTSKPFIIAVHAYAKFKLPQIGDNTNECNIFDINDYNTELELSDIYEVLV